MITRAKPKPTRQQKPERDIWHEIKAQTPWIRVLEPEDGLYRPGRVTRLTVTCSIRYDGSDNRFSHRFTVMHGRHFEEEVALSIEDFGERRAAAVITHDLHEVLLVINRCDGSVSAQIRK